jgi:hypothetical protein
VQPAKFSLLFLALAFAASIARAQQPLPIASPVPDQSSPQQTNAPKPTLNATRPAAHGLAPVEHRFWDRENDLLFTGVAASRTFDYFSTLNMRRRGRQEILLTNDVVDHHAGFAFIEAGGTGVSIFASYVFHHYEHHRLERWTSIVHIGLASTGAVRNYCLKTAHTVPAQPVTR